MIVETVARQLHQRDCRLMRMVAQECRPESWNALLRDFDELDASARESYVNSVKTEFRVLDVSLPCLIEDRNTVSKLFDELREQFLEMESRTDSEILKLQKSNQELQSAVNSARVDLKALFSGLITPESINNRI